jgi:hypothetical protein
MQKSNHVFGLESVLHGNTVVRDVLVQSENLIANLPIPANMISLYTEHAMSHSYLLRE